MVVKLAGEAHAERALTRVTVRQCTTQLDNAGTTSSALLHSMNLSVADLTAFIEIVRSGSISRAAQHLGVTQPSVSKAIRRLEDEVGVQLLERGCTVHA